MPRNNRLTPDERNRGVAMVAAGASLGEAARATGTTRDNIRYHCRKAGVRTTHRAPQRLITIGGRTQRLRAWCREYGIAENTMLMRVRAGDVGERLLRPVRHCEQPEVYELNLPMSEWQRILEYTDWVGCPKRAAKRLGIPRGAVTAAQRGDWERLA